MLDTPAAQVPALSLADNAHDPDAFAQDFGRSFERFGFAVVSDHGIPADLIERAWSLTAEFFALPVEEKRRFFDPAMGGQRGYTPFKTEIAKDAKHVDLKEFWHVGRDLPEGHPAKAAMMPNVWPERPEGFRQALTELWTAFDRTGLQLLSAIARYLKLSPDYFETVVDHGNSILRLLHYPPIPGRRRGRAGRGARGHQPHHPAARRLRKRGWSCSTGTVAGWRSSRRRARWSSTSATCCSG